MVEDVNGMRSIEWGEEAEERGDVMIATVNKNYVGRKMAGGNGLRMVLCIMADALDTGVELETITYYDLVML